MKTSRRQNITFTLMADNQYVIDHLIETLLTTVQEASGVEVETSWQSPENVVEIYDPEQGMLLFRNRNNVLYPYPNTKKSLQEQVDGLEQRVHTRGEK